MEKDYSIISWLPRPWVTLARVWKKSSERSCSLLVTYSKIATAMILMRWAACLAGNQIKLVTFEQTYYNIIPGIPVTTLWNTVKTFNVFITGKNILQPQQFVESLAELNFWTHPKWGWE